MVQSRGALEGVKVVACSTAQAGSVPYMLMADLGAEVIKIEEPQRGDPGRGMAGVMGISTNLPGGKNYYFETNNRNKKGITLDLKKPRALEIVQSTTRIPSRGMGMADLPAIE